MPLHFHGHNDFGLGTALAIAAVRGGADWIQGTVNGIGERAGNSDICEVALALSCLYDVPVDLDLTQARKVSALVQKAANYRVDGWRPVVGDNLFTRESGAVANQFHIPEAIEPYSAELVSAPRRIVLGKKSGLSSIKLKVQELRLDVPERQFPDLLARVKRDAIAAGRLLSDDEFRRLAKSDLVGGS
jgi:isopropylmalate/homocitrate/citramalate synthase